MGGGDNSGSRTLAAVAIVLLLVLPPLTVPAAEAFVTDSGFTVSVFPTLVAPMKEYVLEGAEDITVFRLVPGQKQVLLGGSGHFTLVDISQSPYVVWAWSIVGTATVVEYDDSRTPNWYIVGTDAGEVLAVNAKNPDFRVSYFTAGRAPIIDIGVGMNEQGRSNLFILDNQQFLYIYRLPEESWFEIGPNPRDGPLGSLAGFPVTAATFTAVHDGTGNVTYDSTRLAIILESTPTATVTALAYVPWYNGTILPAQTATWTVTDEVRGQNFTISTKLFYSLVVQPYNIMVNMTEGSNNTIIIENVVPTQHRLFVALVANVSDMATGQLINQTCFSTLTGIFEPTPYETYRLGSLLLEPTGETLEDCIQNYDLDPNDMVPNLAFHPAMVLRTQNLPGSSVSFRTGGDAWIILLPYPSDTPGPGQATIWEAYSYESPVQGWPVGATSLLVAASDRYLYIYVTDSVFYPKNLDTTYGYLEVVDLGNTITSVVTDWTGESIFAGTAAGSVTWLKWIPEQGKYVAVASMQISDTAISSVSYLSGGYVLASTVDGRLQLINLDGWYPVWRGPYAYEGVETGETGLTAEAVGLDLIVAATPSIRSNSFYVMKIANPDLVRATISVELAKVTVEGATSIETLPADSVLEVYDLQGNLLATVSPSENTFLLYVPEGTYRLAFKIPGLGVFEKQVTIEFPEFRDTVRLAYREVKILVTVPPPQEGERYPPDVNVGPLPGALVQAVPGQVDPALGISLTPQPVYGLTNDNGEVVLTLWDGVTYEITASRPGYENASTTIPAYGPVNVNLKLRPLNVEQEVQVIRYYDVEIQVIDDRGVPIQGAIVEIYDAENRLLQTGNTGIDGKVRVRLAEGLYTVVVKADGFLDKTAGINVPTVTQLTVSLDPTNATKIKRLVPYIILIAGLIILLAALWMLRERIARRLAEEEEYF